MATLRDIKRRITSVKNTQQITKAMKMVSAAKLNRAQNAVKEAQPFAQKMREMVTTLSKGVTGDENPFFAAGAEGRTRIIHFTSDRGLCGSFNSGLNRSLQRQLQSQASLKDHELVLVGRSGGDYFKRFGHNIHAIVANEKPADLPARVAAQMDEAIRDFLDGKIGRVCLSYNQFVNPMKQEPTLVQLLPVADGGQEAAKKEETPQAQATFIYEPSRDEILNGLLPQYFQNQAFTALLNTFAGEHGARMVAMEGATKNAGEMIHKLTLQYNRLRQAVITRELIEIINGAQSL